MLRLSTRDPGFVAVQVRVLFGGDRHVQDTDGLTYANYARQGFWQLAAVTVLTLLVVAVALAGVRRQHRLQREDAVGGRAAPAQQAAALQG